jgi:hypothetical protein
MQSSSVHEEPVRSRNTAYTAKQPVIGNNDDVKRNSIDEPEEPAAKRLKSEGKQRG